MAEFCFRKIGGSHQLVFDSAADLPKILTLNPGRWAALGAPCFAFTCDPVFLEYLDADANKFLRIDDVLTGVRYAMEMFDALAVLDRAEPELSETELNRESPEAVRLLDFRAANPGLFPEGPVTLGALRAAIGALRAGTLKGDGALRQDAVAGSGAEALFAAVASAMPAAEANTVTGTTLGAFEEAARAFLAWFDQAEFPAIGTLPPEQLEAAMRPLKDKLDEFFRQCRLVRLDAANIGYFQLKPDALPALDTTDTAAVDAYLAAHPLALPNARMELDFSGELNPYYADAVRAFANAFALEKLDANAWAELKARLAPFEAYCARLAQDPVGRVGAGALTEFLKSPQPEALRKLFAEDALLEGRIAGLRAWEKAILFRRNLLTFVRNFVSLQALFDPEEVSLIQAGTLYMDGRRFHLSNWVDNFAEHKKLASTANLCIIYVELVPQPAIPTPAKTLAVVVSSGEVDNMYAGRPVVFRDMNGKFHHGKVLEFLDGPVSFAQSFSLPFRRLGKNIGDKIKKYTDFGNLEKAVDSGIDNAAKGTPAPPPAPAAPKGAMLNGSMMMLAGGVSLAALGSSLAFMVKSLNQIPLSALLISLGILALLILLPPAFSAIGKLQRRNLSRFLAAAGWVVNLRIRLSVRSSRLFSGEAPYPPRSRFERFFQKTVNDGE